MYTFYVKVESNGVITDRIQYGGKYNVHYPNGIESDWIEDDGSFEKDWVYDFDSRTWSEPEDTRTYVEKRKEAYPSWQDQMDMQYHDLIDGTSTWRDAVESIKTKYPKT